MTTMRDAARTFLESYQTLLRISLQTEGVAPVHGTRGHHRTISMSRDLRTIQNNIQRMEQAVASWSAPPPPSPRRRGRPPQQRTNNRTAPYARPPTASNSARTTSPPPRYRIDPEVNFTTTFSFLRHSLQPFDEPVCSRACECTYSSLCQKTVSFLKTSLIPGAPPAYILRSFLRHALCIEYGVPKDLIPPLPMNIRNTFIYLAYHKMARTHFNLKSQDYAFNERDIGFDSVLGALRILKTILTDPTDELGLDLAMVSRHIICYAVRYYLKGHGSPSCHLLDRNSWAFGLAAEARFDVLARQTVEDKEMMGVVFSGDDMSSDDLHLKDVILKAWTTRQDFWFSELRRKITGGVLFKMSRFRAEDGKDHTRLIKRDRELEELWGIGVPAGVLYKPVAVDGIGKIEVDSFGLWCQWLSEGKSVLGRL